MRIIIAIFSIILLMWAERASAQPQRTYSVSVSYQKDLTELTVEQVQNILADASKVLQKSPDHRDWEDDDVACNVAFTLIGSVRKFASPDKVFGELDFEDLHRVDPEVAGADFHIKLVKEILLCREEPSGFRGCAFPPENRTIVALHPSQLASNFPNHILWAHEFGHLAGLGHRKNELSLMKCGGVTSASVQVNRRECFCMLRGPGPDACKLPPPRFC